MIMTSTKRYQPSDDLEGNDACRTMRNHLLNKTCYATRRRRVGRHEPTTCVSMEKRGCQLDNTDPVSDVMTLKSQQWETGVGLHSNFVDKLKLIGSWFTVKLMISQLVSVYIVIVQKLIDFLHRWKLCV